jgi:hypothetical protein
MNHAQIAHEAGHAAVAKHLGHKASGTVFGPWRSVVPAFISCDKMALSIVFFMRPVIVERFQSSAHLLEVTRFGDFENLLNVMLASRCGE